MSGLVRWRLRRDLCICALAGLGTSQRVLADVFDLPQSRISMIVRHPERLAAAIAAGLPTAREFARGDRRPRAAE
jgi:hypothetical protein